MLLFLQGNAHDRKVLELQGVIRKEVSSQTDADEVTRERPKTSLSTPQVAKLIPPASAAEVHQIKKVPAFHILSEAKASDASGPPKWKRQLMARNQTAAVSQHFV